MRYEYYRDLGRRGTGGVWSASDGVGVNIETLAYDSVVAGGIVSTTWPTTVDSTDLAALRNAGFSWVRLSVDPTPALRTTTAETLAAVVDYARVAINDCRAAGFRVLLDLHVSGSDATWGDTALRGDYPSSAKWLKLLDVVRAYAALVETYPTRSVALEPYNESAIATGSTWPAMMKSVHTAARQVNTKSTLVICGANYASIPGLLELSASNFDRRTKFKAHGMGYAPTLMTYQAIAGVGSPYITRMAYPPVRSDEDDLDANIVTLVNADAGVPGGSKAATIATHQGFVDVYMTGGQKSSDPDTYTKMGEVHLDFLASQITGWATSNSVDPSRIIMTEFGVHGDYLAEGASKLSRCVWFASQVRRFKANSWDAAVYAMPGPGFWSVGTVLDPGALEFDWSPDPDLLVALGLAPVTTYEAEATALFARMTGTVSNRRKAIINTTIRLLKAAGVWSQLDAFWRTDADSDANARLNWTGDFYNLVPNAGASWAANVGYTFDGVTGEIETFFQPGQSQMLQNDAHVAVDVAAPNTNAGTYGFFKDGGFQTAYGWSAFDGVAVTGINNTSGVPDYLGPNANGDIPVQGGIGHGVISRSAAGSYVCYFDGQVQFNSSLSSATPIGSGATLKYGGTIVGPATDYTMAGGSVGGGLTDQQARDLAHISLFHKLCVEEF